MKRIPADGLDIGRNLWLDSLMSNSEHPTHCAHCGESISGHTGFAEVHGHESTPICLDCADLFSALDEVGVFDSEGCTVDAFFVTAN